MNRSKKIISLLVFLSANFSLLAHRGIGELIQAIKDADCEGVVMAAQTADVNIYLGLNKETPLMIAINAMASEAANNILSWQAVPKLISGTSFSVGGLYSLLGTAEMIMGVSKRIIKVKDHSEDIKNSLSQGMQDRIGQILRPVIIGLIGIVIVKKMQSDKAWMVEKRKAVVKKLLELSGLKLDMTNDKGQTVLDIVQNFIVEAMKNDNQPLMNAMKEIEPILLEKMHLA